MSVRVLIIDDQVEFRRLLAQHVSTGFDSPSIAEYDPAERGRLPADFSGSAYDAVLLGDTPGSEEGLSWLRDLSRRNDFPAVIYLIADKAAESEEAAIAAGAHACLARRKIDHAGLVAALRAAQARRGPVAGSARPTSADSGSSASSPRIRYRASISRKADSPASRSC
jgi:DNA-binding NarL/FixJ family response regulator